MESVKNGLVEQKEIGDYKPAKADNPGMVPTAPKGEKASKDGRSFTIK